MKYVSLTYDDGPNNVPGDNTMNDMLDILEKHGIVASFFIIGNKVTEENKKVIRRAFDMGCDIENHSWTHPAMADMSVEEIKEEYEKCDKVIEEITGKKAGFFRPPYISVGKNLYEAIKVPFICGAGCRDWEPQCTAEERYQIMKDTIQDGTLVLLHVMENNKATLEAVDRIIPELKADGYEFVTVPEMFKIKKQDAAVEGSLWTVVKGE